MTTTEDRAGQAAAALTAGGDLVVDAVDPVGAVSGRRLSGGAAGAARARRLARGVLPVLTTLVAFLGIWLAVSYLVLTPERR